MTKLQTLASEVAGYFHRATRIDGTEFIKTTDNRPDWVLEMCHAVHGDMWPDDWKYQFISDAVDALAENEDADEIRLEADIYTRDLLDWLGSRLDRFGYVDDAVEEFGGQYPDGGIIAAISWGQLREKEEVLGAVRSFLESRLEDMEEEAVTED